MAKYIQLPDSTQQTEQNKWSCSNELFSPARKACQKPMIALPALGSSFLRQVLGVHADFAKLVDGMVLNELACVKAHKAQPWTWIGLEVAGVAHEVRQLRIFACECTG